MLNELIKLYCEFETDNDLIREEIEEKKERYGKKLLNYLKDEGYEFGRNAKVDFVDISKENAYCIMNGRRYKIIETPMFVSYDKLNNKGEWERGVSYLP